VLAAGVGKSKMHTSPSLECIDDTVTYTPENCVVICFGCNASRGTRTIPEFLAWLAQASRIATFYTNIMENSNDTD